MTKLEIAIRINEIKKTNGLKEEKIEKLVKNTKLFLEGKLAVLENLGCNNKEA